MGSTPITREWLAANNFQFHVDNENGETAFLPLRLHDCPAVCRLWLLIETDYFPGLTTLCEGDDPGNDKARNIGLFQVATVEEITHICAAFGVELHNQQIQELSNAATNGVSGGRADRPTG